MTDSMIEEMHKLARFGGRWSTARSAPDDKVKVQEFLEARNVHYTLTFHPRPGWQFIVLAPEKREP